jgi:hypothetical protein
LRKHNSFLILPLFLFAAVSAQVTVQDIIVDSIDVFSQQDDKSIKSSKTAMAASLLIPGLGHHYLGNAKPALGYICLDVLSVFGAVMCSRQAKTLLVNSRGYASTYAHITRGSNDESYWNLVGQFDNMEYYNQVTGLNRQKEDQITNFDLNWDWDSDYHKEEYVRMRKNSHVFQTVSSLFLGAMVLNRIVAFVDIRAKTRYKGITGTALKIQPSISPDLSTAGILISKQF